MVGFDGAGIGLDGEVLVAAASQRLGDRVEAGLGWLNRQVVGLVLDI